MTLYKADVWLGSNSGYQTVEISASSINGVAEQIQNIYKVNKEQIRNIREVHNNKETTATSDETVSLVVVVIIILFILSPSIFLMFLCGSLGAWIPTLISKKSFGEISEPKNKKLYATIMIISLFCGGFGYYVGHKIEQDVPTKTK
jgi:flagellar biosynthesis protein FliP